MIDLTSGADDLLLVACRKPGVTVNFPYALCGAAP